MNPKREGWGKRVRIVKQRLILDFCAFFLLFAFCFFFLLTKVSSRLEDSRHKLKVSFVVSVFFSWDVDHHDFFLVSKFAIWLKILEHANVTCTCNILSVAERQVQLYIISYIDFKCIFVVDTNCVCVKQRVAIACVLFVVFVVFRNHWFWESLNMLDRGSFSEVFM